MSYQEDLNSAMEELNKFCEKFPELRTEGIELKKLFNDNSISMDLFYAIDRLLEKISNKPERMFTDDTIKARIISLKDNNVFKIVRPIENEKERTICNISEHTYSDRFENPVPSFDDVIEEIIQVIIDELKGKGPFEADKDFIKQAYLDEIEKLPEEKKERSNKMLLDGAESGIIYEDNELLRMALRDKLRKEFITFLREIPKRYRESKEIGTIVITSKQGEKKHDGGVGPSVNKERENELIDFSKREKILLEYKPREIINILDTANPDSKGNGKCFIYDNPSITNNMKNENAKQQKQKGKLCIFEPINGASMTKLFFIPESNLEENTDISKVIKEYLEMPVDQFCKEEGTASVFHTKMESFLGSINFYLTGERSKTLTFFEKSSEHIKDLYRNNTIDVGYRPRDPKKIAKIAGGAMPDFSAIPAKEDIQKNMGDE